MDQAILSKNGVEASNPRKGYLNDYALKIGNRASLVPCKNERSYGIVMTLDAHAVSKLYAEASIADYVPEKVEIFLGKDEPITATCYNLPSELLIGTNISYAKTLYELAKKEKFPAAYLEKIRQMT